MEYPSSNSISGVLGPFTNSLWVVFCSWRQPKAWLNYSLGLLEHLPRSGSVSRPSLVWELGAFNTNFQFPLSFGMLRSFLREFCNKDTQGNEEFQRLTLEFLIIFFFKEETTGSYFGRGAGMRLLVPTSAARELEWSFFLRASSTAALVPPPLPCFPWISMEWCISGAQMILYSELSGFFFCPLIPLLIFLLFGNTDLGNPGSWWINRGKISPFLKLALL